MTSAPPARNLGDSIDSWDGLFGLRDREIHVVGAGSVEGAHLLLFLLDHGFTRLTGHDFNTQEAFPRAFTRVHVGWPLEQRHQMLDRLLSGVEMRYRDRYLDGIQGAEAIAVTQGWYLYDSNRQLVDDPSLQARFFSLVQLYLGLAPGPVVGVSGSQGKSTTTRVLRDMLIADGRDVIFAGNDRHGQQALDRLEKASANTHLVLEISNRHLKMLRRSPHVAVLTNVYPNHLDEHGGWEGYVAAKAGLVRHQREGDIAVLNADLEVTREMAELTPGAVHWFGERLDEAEHLALGVMVSDAGLRAVGDWQRPAAGAWTLSADDITLPGRHNALNIAAAATAALAMGVDPGSVSRAARAFRGLKHRLQFVWSAGGVKFYDDLNSTTPTATEVALRTLGSNVVWILGGEDKGLDGASLAATARHAVRTALALPGGGTEAIARGLEAEGVRVERVADFGDAVARAVAIAEAGDSVLLSPACPGFFSLYYVGVDEDTGFKKLVRQATLPATSPPVRKPRASAGPG